MNSFGINAGVTRPFIEFLRLSLGWAIIFIIFLKVNLTVPERCWTGRAWLGSLFTQGTNMNHFLKRRGFLAGFWWDMGSRTISLPSAQCPAVPQARCHLLEPSTAPGIQELPNPSLSILITFSPRQGHVAKELRNGAKCCISAGSRKITEFQDHGGWKRAPRSSPSYA